MSQNNYVTDAINLKSYPLSEFDKIVVMYSKDKGLFKGVARGIKKPKSSLGGRMELLVANKLLLNKGKNLDIIKQADILNTFLNTRKDMDKLFFSIYCSEIVNNFGIENDPNSKEIFELLYAVLTGISKAENKTSVILNVLKFQLKIMNIVGYAISFKNCAKCGKIMIDNADFIISLGGIICEDCSFSISEKKNINYKIIQFLDAIQNEKFENKTKYEELLNEKVVNVCFNLLKDYINFYSPKKIKTSNVMEMING